MNFVMERREVAAAALLATALAAQGCGGSSKSSQSASSQPSMTRAALIAKADPVCGRINKKIEFYSNLKPSDSRDLVSAAAVERAAPLIASFERSAHDELAKLAPPSSMAADWREIVDGVEAIANDTQQLGQDLSAKVKVRGKIAGLTASATITLQHVNAVAARNGFKDCARLA
jgi:hypothetical protein